MPFLRFSKDRRGYESTFLLHAHRAVERDAVLLYWFRTPPHVKMGRAALDEETIRVLEDTHPSVNFDWPRILATRPQPSEPAPDPNRPPGARRRGEREERGHGRPPRPAPARVVPSATPSPAAGEPPRVEPEATAPVDTPATPSPSRVAIPAETPEPIEPEAPVRKFTRIFDAPSGEVGVGGTPSGAAPAETGRLSEPSASDRALGSEQLERLRGRYAAVMARIGRRIADAALADRLRAIAENANPDNWVTDEEVRAGLAGLNAVYAQLVPHVGRRRRRRSGRRPQTDGTTVAGADALSQRELVGAEGPSPEAEASDPDDLEDDEESPESGG